MGLVKKSVQSNKNISDLCGEKYFHGILCFSSKQPRSGSRGPTHVTTRKIFNPENFSFLLGWEFFLGTNCGSRSFLLNKKNNCATICEELCTFGTICEYKISQHGNLKVHLAASNIQKESAAKWIIQWICAQQHCKSHFDMRHPVVVRPDQTTSIIITLT